MAYDAKVIEVMIASPSDVREERDIVREVIAEWNVLHSRERNVVMLPLGWDTHSSPELAGRPQQMINDRLLKHADVLVGIFWTRIGTPTGHAQSGTVEEVQEHHAAGRPVMLYFSDQPVRVDSVDREQYDELQNFKNWARQEGLVQGFDGPQTFRDHFRRHLQIMLQSNSYITDITEVDFAKIFEAALGEQQINLSEQAEVILRAAADSDGIIIVSRSIDGETVQTGGQRYGQGASPREVARWLAAVEDLRKFGFAASTRERDVLQLTDAGYSYVEGQLA